MVHADQNAYSKWSLNLLVNSIKYGKTNGTTEVAIEDLINSNSKSNG
jgi:two-component system phosphate regulon sensor histidine kinase PhoR